MTDISYVMQIIYVLTPIKGKNRYFGFLLGYPSADDVKQQSVSHLTGSCTDYTVLGKENSVMHPTSSW